MFTQERCLICRNPTSVHREIPIADLLRIRCGLPNIKTRLRYCKSCDFWFFEHRLTQGEEEALYKDYRGKEYTRQRLRFEPHYLESSVFYENDDFRNARISHAQSVVKSWPISPETVLDFGGGDGWLCKALFPNAEVHTLEPGQGAKLHKYDLVYAAYVFEHVADPRKTLNGLLSRGYAVYIEVPIGEAEPDYMHEHVSGFSVRALTRLMDGAFQVDITPEGCGALKTSGPVVF